MINLIPPSAQKEVKKEYALRVATVLLSLIASACMIVVILCVPVYVLIRSQLDAFLSEYTQAHSESETYKDAEAAIVEANNTAQLLSLGHKDITLGEIVGELKELSGTDIAITETLLSRTADGLAPMSIKGTASSRLALTAFQTKLEDHPQFKNVVLPLSNLARDKDIVFNITVELENTQP